MVAVDRGWIRKKETENLRCDRKNTPETRTLAECFFDLPSRNGNGNNRILYRTDARQETKIQNEKSRLTLK